MGEKKKNIPKNTHLTKVNLSPEQERLAVHSGKPLLLHTSRLNSSAFALSPDGTTLAIGGEGQILLWDIASRSTLRSLRGPKGARALRPVFTRSGEFVVAYFDKEYKVRVYDVRSGRVVRYLDKKGKQLDAKTLIRHPTKDLVLAVEDNGGVLVLNLSTGETVFSVEPYPCDWVSSVKSIALSSDGSLFATSRDEDNDIRVFDTNTGERTLTLWFHAGEVTSVAFSPVDDLIASACDDGIVRVWNSMTGTLLHSFEGNKDIVNDLVFAPTGQRIYSAGSDSTVRVWDVNSGKLLRTLEIGVERMEISPDAKTLIASTEGLVVLDLLAEYEDLDQVIEIAIETSGGAKPDSPAEAENQGEEADADKDGQPQPDAEDGAADDEPATSPDDSSGTEDSKSLVGDGSVWTLPTAGNVGWQSVVAWCGSPVEGSIPTEKEWQAAVQEGRVVTIHHSNTGKPYYARVGLYTNDVMCRAVFNRPLPRDIILQDVDLDEVNWDFALSVANAVQATELLLCAVNDNDASRVEAAIRAGANVNVNWGEPLSLAADKGQLPIVKLLIEEGHANLHYNDASTLWREATFRGHDHIASFFEEAVLNEFKERFYGNTKPYVQETLVQAAHEGRADLVEKLLAAGGTIDASSTVYPYKVRGTSLDALKGTPLTVAAAAGHRDMVALLLSKGGGVNARDDIGISPWMAAAAAGHGDICQQLESRGAKVGTQTALVLAAWRGHVEALGSLLEHGGNPNASAKVDHRMTPLEAVICGELYDNDSHVPAQQRAKFNASRLRAMELLLARGANPNAISSHSQRRHKLWRSGGSVSYCVDGVYPLLLRAVDMDFSEAVALLLKSGVDIERRNDGEQETALFAAAEQRKTNIVQLLLRAGADPNVKDKTGRTPLIAAVDAGFDYIETVCWLLAFGANPNLTTKAGKTARHYAKLIIRKSTKHYKEQVKEAKNVIKLLDNDKQLAAWAGQFARTPESADGWLARADCALTWLNEPLLAIEALVASVRADTQAISDVAKRLASRDPLIRYVAAAAIELLGIDAAAATPTLIKRLRTEDLESITIELVNALAAIGTSVIKPLLELLRADTPRIARRAAVACCIVDPAHCEIAVELLHRRIPGETKGLAGDALLEAAELHGVCGDLYNFVGNLSATVREYEISVALNSDVETGRADVLAVVRWKLGLHPNGMIENSIGMRFVPLPSGEFIMGAPKDEPGTNCEEELLHRVRITRPFYIGMCAVTQGEFTRVMGSNPSHFRDPRLPVEHVSWQQAKYFSKRLSQLPDEKQAGRVYRLPTEAEWEYACRAGTSTAYSWGDTSDHEYANYCEENEYTGAPLPTVSVGSRPPNAFGLHEMHGNVWEWCRDWYQVDYYGQSPSSDPCGPEDGHHHVLRGGSASVGKHECRAAFRGHAESAPQVSPSPNAKNCYQQIGDFGFRVVCEVSVE